MTDKLDELLADEPRPDYHRSGAAYRNARNEFRAVIRPEVAALRAERDRLREAAIPALVRLDELAQEARTSRNAPGLLAALEITVPLRAALAGEEQCKDGTRMGVGMPEYLLIFRKPPTDNSDGYADVPVVKDKATYSRARWQTDAHGFARSSGNRLLTVEDVRDLEHDRIYQRYREESLNTVYDYEAHVALGESMEEAGRLPVTFQLLPPHSWHTDVWTDVARMRTLNSQQYSKGKEMHLCPLQFDIVDRVITQMSMEGETVFDPFSGIGTVPLRAVKLGRRGLGCELSLSYHDDAVYWLKKEESGGRASTIFDFIEEAAS